MTRPKISALQLVLSQPCPDHDAGPGESCWHCLPGVSQSACNARIRSAGFRPGTRSAAESERPPRTPLARAARAVGSRVGDDIRSTTTTTARL